MRIMVMIFLFMGCGVSMYCVDQAQDEQVVATVADLLHEEVAQAAFEEHGAQDVHNRDRKDEIIAQKIMNLEKEESLYFALEVFGYSVVAAALSGVLVFLQSVSH